MLTFLKMKKKICSLQTIRERKMSEGKGQGACPLEAPS